jgi:hypothetical protein
MPDLRFEKIPFEAISNDFPWSLHQDLPDRLPTALVSSITLHGLLHPPIARRIEPGSFEIVCGARRLRTVRGLGAAAEICCLLIDPHLNTLDLLRLLVADQSTGGPLTAIETARFIKLCKTWCPRQAAKIIESTTGISGDNRCALYLKLLDLELPVREAVHRGLISLHVASSLSGMTQAERLFLIDLFARLSMNKNKQRRLIDLAKIIAAADNCSLETLIASDYPELMQPSIVNIPQTTGRLLQDLYERSHPLSTAAQKKFINQSAGLGLPRNCSLSHSPAFEQEWVRLHIEFDRFDDLAETWDKIKAHLQYQATKTR